MIYPATITVQTPASMENWRPLVQWILAVPHLLIANALAYVSGALSVVSWFWILFTGSLPESLANFQIMILRYTTRAQLYGGFLYDQFPPFEFSMTAVDPGGSPVEIQITPALENRDRLSVGLRLIWLIPAMLYAVLVGIVGLICWLLGFFAVLFTGRWPDALRRWVMSLNRVGLRFQVYALMLTDDYPPFSLD